MKGREKVLRAHHRRELIEGSGISPEVVDERGYFTAEDKATLAQFEFSEIQSRVPALVISMFSPTGERVTHQIKPDSPRTDAKGRPIKYETPRGSEIRLDIHPSQAKRAMDPSVRLWVTEGVKKGDALASRGECAVVLQGVYCWQKDGVPLADWEGVRLHGREVYVVFDSDVTTNPKVRAALERLVAFLRSRGAKVMVVYLPSGESGEKMGVDDFFVAGGTVEELMSLAEDGLRHEITAVKTLTFKTAREISEAAPEEPPFIARPWVVEGAITELVGPIKQAGKTSWALAMCRKILDGESFMGKETTRTKIVFLTEQPLSSFVVALRRADLLDREDFYALEWQETIGTPWEEVVRAATEKALELGAKILVVDTLAQFAGLKGDEENNAGAAHAAMRPLQEAAGRGLGVVVVRHERKAGGEVGESGRGSTGFGGTVDTILTLRRAEGNTRPTIRKIKAISRFDGVPDTLMIELGDDGEYRALGSDPAVATTEARSKILEVIPVIEIHAKPKEEIFDKAGITHSTGYKVLMDFVEKGEVKRVGKGVKGKPHRYYRPDPPGADGFKEKLSFHNKGGVENESLEAEETPDPGTSRVGYSNAPDVVSPGTVLFPTPSLKGNESKNVPERAPAEGNVSVADDVAQLFSDPPEWLQLQATECLRQDTPERLLNPLSNAISTHLYGSPWRWREVLPEVKKALERAGIAGRTGPE